MSLSVAMLTTYKEDILAALEHLAYLRGISTIECMKISLYNHRRSRQLSKMRHTENEEQERMMLRVHLISSSTFRVCVHCSKLSTGYMYLLLCTLPWYMYTNDTQKKPGKRRKLQSAGMKDE